MLMHHFRGKFLNPPESTIKIIFKNIGKILEIVD